MKLRSSFLTLILTLLSFSAFSQTQPSSIPEDILKQSDNEAFVEWSVRFGDLPSADCRQRTFARAQTNHSISLYWTAELKRKGLLTPQQSSTVDLEKYYKQSTQGFAPGIAVLAQMDFDRGETQKALDSFRSLETSGCKLCQQVTGEFYARPGEYQNLDKALISLKNAEKQGNLLAAHDLIAVYESLSKPTDRDKAIQTALSYCDPETILKIFAQLPDNSPQANDLYCKMLLIGKEKFNRTWESDQTIAQRIQQSPDSALISGILKNDPVPMRQLALKIKSTDPHLARILLFRAERLGDDAASAILSEARITGAFQTIQREDLGKSLLEFGVSRQPPNIHMQWTLGQLLTDGKSLPKNPTRGAQLIRLAATAGQQDAQKYLSTPHP